MNSITTSTGVYYFTNNINSGTLLNGEPNFTRIAYRNGRYVCLYAVLIPIYVYTSTDGIYYNYQPTSSLTSIINANYNAPYRIHDGTKFIACGYSISSGPAICYSTDAITTWTGCSN